MKKFLLIYFGIGVAVLIYAQTQRQSKPRGILDYVQRIGLWPVMLFNKVSFGGWG